MQRNSTERPARNAFVYVRAEPALSEEGDLNAYAERFVRSIKEECLEMMIPLGEPHPRRAVHEYLSHYHRERNHQGLNNQLIESLPIDPPTKGPVLCRDRLGGMLNYYYREAA